MASPKHIHEITIDDLKSHRWCFYHNDELGFDGFEHAIPDAHPEFSPDVMEIELCEFVFANGQTLLGIYDGSKNFTVEISGAQYSFWFGVIRPSPNYLEELRLVLRNHGLELPVKALSTWSGTQATFSGIQYVDSSGTLNEIAI